VSTRKAEITSAELRAWAKRITSAELRAWAKRMSDETGDKKYLAVVTEFLEDNAFDRHEHARQSERFIEERRVRCPSCKTSWGDLELHDPEAQATHGKKCIKETTDAWLVERFGYPE
jgi:hypothetical protein